MREVDLSNVIICSLNYDLLLPRAAELFGKSFYITGFEREYHRVIGGKSYVEERPRPKLGDPSSAIELLLPHGSAGLVDDGNSWAHNQMGVEFKYENIAPETYSTGLCLDAQKLNEFYKSELNPIMSFIHSGKHTIMGWKNLEATRARFATVCGECDGIAIVGMQLNMRDQHISRPLIEARAPVLTAVVNDGPAYHCLRSRPIDTGQTWRGAFAAIASFLQK